MEISRDMGEQEHKKKDWPFSYFKFDDKRDSPDEVRNSIMVVAALVATASFQAVMDPPDTITNFTLAKRIVFVCANTLAWASSMSIIEMLTASFPFQREIRLSYLAMGSAFGLAAGELLGDNSTRGIRYILFVACCFLPWVLRWVPAFIKSIWRRCRVN